MEDQKRTDKEKIKNPPNLYKRGDSWILDFFYRGDRHTENLGPVSRTIAKETRDKRKGEAAAGKLEIGTKVKDAVFETVCTEYLEFYQANTRPRSYERHAMSSIPLKAFFGTMRLSQITPFQVDKYKLDRKSSCVCVTKPKEKVGRCPTCKHLVRGKADATINRELAMLRHLFSKAIAWKYAKVSPFGTGSEKAKLYKENNGRTRYLTQEEAGRLLKECNDDLRPVVLLAMHSGFRKSEIKTLKWGSVNFSSTSITVESCYSKNGDSRTVPMTPDVLVSMKALYDERKPEPDDVVFTLDGEEWGNWRKAFAGACSRAKITSFRFHDLRHCFGSWLAMNGVPDKGRMQLMGHKRPEMTARYTHLSVDYMRKAVADLPAFGHEKTETESQQISQRGEASKVVAFGK